MPGELGSSLAIDPLQRASMLSVVLKYLLMIMLDSNAGWTRSPGPGPGPGAEPAAGRRGCLRLLDR